MPYPTALLLLGALSALPTHAQEEIRYDTHSGLECHQNGEAVPCGPAPAPLDDGSPPPEEEPEYILDMDRYYETVRHYLEPDPNDPHPFPWNPPQPENDPPVLENESVRLRFDWDEYGATFSGATVSGSFEDPNGSDRHTLSIVFGDGIYTPVQDIPVGDRTFSESIDFGGIDQTDFARFFPVVIKIDDHRGGTDTYRITHSCADAQSMINIEGVQYVAGRGQFVRLIGDQPYPGVILKEWEGENGSDDGVVGGDIEVYWAADKMEFLQKGQCSIGFVQIVKRTVNYSSWVPHLFDHDWRIDGPVPYPHPAQDSLPTSTNPFSKGLLSLGDVPGQPYVFPVLGYLRSVEWDFETCVVALPTGSGHKEASVDLSYDHEEMSHELVLGKMAVYGCINWAARLESTVEDDTEPRGHEDFEARLRLQNNVSGAELTYTGAGDGPSDVFIELIKRHYAETLRPN